MSQPVYLPKLEATVDGYVDPNAAIVKQVTAKRNAFGGVVFEHVILPNNSGGSVGIGQGTSDSVKTYNTSAAITPNMALVFNATGGLVTPNFSDAILSPATQTNFIGVAKTSTPENVHNWIQIAIQQTTPQARYLHLQQYVPSLESHVIFGGLGAAENNILGDTMLWDGHNWSVFNGTEPTNGRYGCAATVDTTHHSINTSHNIIVIFGGANGVDGLLSETWIFDGANWYQPTDSAGTPSARVHAAMAFQSSDGYTVMFGGYTGGEGGGLNDSTWILSLPGPYANDSHWTEQFPLNSPTGRMNHSMCYDPVRKRTILFGGTDRTSTFNDTWEWTGSDWMLISTATAPPPRMLASMTYDPINKVVVLFGGYMDSALNVAGAFNIYSDIWYYDGVNWTQQLFFGPSPRAGSGLSFDKVQNYLFLFGGANGGSTRNLVFNNSETAVYQDPWKLLTLTNQVDVQTAGETYVYWDSFGLLAVAVGGLVRGSDTTTVTVTTKLPHGFSNGDKFFIELPGDPHFTAGTYTITAIVDDHNFTYTSFGTVTASVNPIVIGTIVPTNTLAAAEVPSVKRYLSAGIVPGTVTPNGFGSSNDGFDPIFGIVSEAPVTDVDGSLFQTLIGPDRVGLVKMKIGAFHGFITGLNPQLRYSTPASGPVGTEVVVVGAGFNTTTSVLCGDNAFGNISAPYQVTSASHVTVTVPVGAQTYAAIGIHASTGTISVPFTVTPKITSIDVPSHAIGSLFTITGTTFSLAAGAIGTALPSIGIPPNNLVFTGVSGPVTLPFVTTIASGSNGATLPQATIYVADTSQFPTAGGTIFVTTTGGVQSVVYTGISGNTFTGCSAGSGTMSTGNDVYYGFMVVDDSTIQSPIPPGAISGPITLGTADGYTSFHLDVLQAPTITLIAPLVGPAGAGVAVTGTGFTTSGTGGDGYGVLTFVAGVQTLSTTRVIYNDTTMTATVPTMPGGQGATAFHLVFTNSAGTVTSSLQYTIVPPPKFLTAANSTLNGGINSSQTTVTLVSASGWPTGGSKFFVDSEQISYASISGNILQGCTRGINGTTAAIHSNGAAANIYTFISQTNDFQGVSGEMVRIFGEHGFTGTTLVGFGSFNATTFTFINDGYVTAIVPAAISSDNIVAPITIIAGAGSSSTDVGVSPTTNPHTFTILEAPTISSISNPGNVLGPTTGKTGDLIYISGTNFLGTTSVTFAGTTVSASFTIVNPNVIQTTVPDPANVSYSGLTTGVITIKKSTFFTATSPSFTYFSAPSALSVTSPSPDGGTDINVNGGYGTPVTLTGVNLNQGTPTYPIVNFGGVGPATLGSVGPTTINVTVPNGANSGVVVTTAGGAVSVAFTVLKPVTITRFYTDWPYDHTYATPYYPSNIDLYGSNFRNPSNSVIVVSDTHGHVAYVSSFTYHDSSHITFNAAALGVFVGETCYITVYTYYPGGSYNATTYGLNVFYPIT